MALGRRRFEIYIYARYAKRPVDFIAHDPSWIDDFVAESRKIREVLVESSITVEHVGSTAIPTVHAKPILDIAILCGEGGINPVIQALVRVGYEYRGIMETKMATIMQYWIKTEFVSVKFIYILRLQMTFASKSCFVMHFERTQN